MQVGRIEESCIHDMQREFEQALCSKWSERLRRASTITNGFVIAYRTIIREARLIEFAG